MSTFVRCAMRLAAAIALGTPGVALAQAGATGPNPSSVQTGVPGLTFVKTKMPLFAYAAPTESSAVIDELVGQTVLQTSGCSGGWCRVVMARAAPSYIRQNLLEPVAPRR
ncbi:MAG: hypothetical protein INR64_18780 [Caulobacteraceae bacterium]|nr:hypothetical protein [Caulobacter sp.]